MSLWSLPFQIPSHFSNLILNCKNARHGGVKFANVVQCVRRVSGYLERNGSRGRSIVSYSLVVGIINRGVLYGIDVEGMPGCVYVKGICNSSFQCNMGIFDIFEVITVKDIGARP